MFIKYKLLVRFGEINYVERINTILSILSIELIFIAALHWVVVWLFLEI